MQDKIIIKGAREHNLKNVSLELPRNKMIVFTGLSGSGKSSLAFDTIFAEGQRRYIESLSAYARQFLGGMQKPDVDEISGLSPAISIDQKAHSANPRSTVATITEIYDYLRVLYARIGEPHCPLCGTKIEKMTTDEMVERIGSVILSERSESKDPLHKDKEILRLHSTSSHSAQNDNRGELIVLAPVVRGRKGEYYQMLYDLYNSGFLEVRVDGKMYSLKERINLKKNFKHSIDVVVDRLIIPIHQKVERNLSEEVVSDKLMTNVIKIVGDKKDSSPRLESEFGMRLGEAVETAVDLSNGLCTVIYPNGEEQIFSTEYSCPKDGFSFPEIEPRLFSFNSPYGYCPACTGLGTKELFSEEICPKCEGRRLNDNALSVKINGHANGQAGKNIWEIVSMHIGEVRDFFAEIDLSLSERDQEIAGAVLREIENRLQFMHDVGLHYLTLNRTAGTLSGGEAQRIRLASQVGTKLVGALYVLDEPTIGLHQKDNDQLVKTLRNLCDVGNTIIVVEHDEDTIMASDWIVDLGPGAGEHGGKVVYSGPRDVMLSEAQSAKSKHLEKFRDPSTTPPAGGSAQDDVSGCEILGDAKKSLTGQYLRREKKIEEPNKRRQVGSDTPKLKIKGATEHNLKNITVEIPLRRFVCLTGVSGSGKSTLMNNILYRALMNKFFRMQKPVGAYKEIVNTEYLDKVISIDQSPIGRTPRSNPATYTKAFDHIRELFAETPEARMRGFKSGRFSFNVPGGRCENCEGRGFLEIEMHFLPSVEIVCDVCKGQRFNNETLQIHYKEKNIAEILNMTIEEAEDFFRDIPLINDKLKILNEVGLSYLRLGQSATTLSGGEAQRIKLSKELARQDTGKTLYLLDEPTTGLHYDDVRKLIDVIQRLTSRGNTVLVIEHNLDVIKCADWIIDLGPEGGDKGGQVVAIGTPEEVARKKGSWTGEYLKRLLV